MISMREVLQRRWNNYLEKKTNLARFNNKEKDNSVLFTNFFCFAIGR